MKYKVKQYILRAAPLILVCCMFLFVFSPSVSADPINYRDLDYTVMVDGDNDIVTVSLPVDLTRIRVYDDDWKLVLDSVSQELDISGGGYWMSNISFEFLSGSGLSISNIPVDTIVTFNFNFDYDLTAIDGGTLSVHLKYMDSSGSILENKIFSIGDHPIGLFSAEFTLSSVPSATAVFPTVWWYPEFAPVASPGRIYMRVNSVLLTMSISSLYRLQEETGRSNELLDEVNRQLEEQGKDLDQIINGSVDPEAPEGADRIEDLDQAEGQLRDDAQAGLDEGVQIQQNVLQILEQYANGFAVFSWLFGLFAKQPFISGLLYVSVSLGTVGAILNLGLTVAKASGSRAGKAGKAGKGG